MPARSVECILVNTSATPLVLVTNSQHLDGGKWTDGAMPPTTVTQSSPGRWGSQSHGFMTGTQGSVSYTVGDTGKQIHMNWNNPYAGADHFGASADPPFMIQTVSSHGNDAIATYIFSGA